MATNCFTNLIGIRGDCNAAVPTSGLYLDDHPGITVSSAGEIVSDADETGLALAQKAIRLGIDEAKRALVREMMNIVNFHAITFSELGANFVADDYLPAPATDSGIKIELCTKCRLSGLYVPYVNVQFENSGSGTLKILDGDTTTSFTFTSVAKRTICVVTNYRPLSDEISIVVEAGTLKPNNSILNHSCFTCPSIIECDCQKGTGATLTGVGASESYSYSVQPLINLECSEEKFFCEAKHLAATAAWYNSGLRFWEEASINTNMTPLVIYNQAQIKEQIENLKSKAETEIKSLVEKLPTYLSKIDNCCIDCGSSRWVYSKP